MQHGSSPRWAGAGIGSHRDKAVFGETADSRCSRRAAARLRGRWPEEVAAGESKGAPRSPTSGGRRARWWDYSIPRWTRRYPSLPQLPKGERTR